MGELVVRLALTASQNFQAADSIIIKNVQADDALDEETLAGLETELEEAYRMLRELEEEHQEYVYATEGLQKDAQKKLNVAVAELKRVAKVTGTHESQISVPGRVSDTLTNVLQSLKGNLLEQESKAKAAEAEVQRLRAELQNIDEMKKTNDETDPVAEMLDTVRAILAKFEFSGEHGHYTFKDNRPVPCCPICKGLDPNRVKHKDSGHRSGCSMGALVKEISGLG